MSNTYRLYYSADGTPITYVCGEHESTDAYIEITREQYARCDMNVIVLSGRIVSRREIRTTSRYCTTDRSSPGAIYTSAYNINIIPDCETTTGQYWHSVVQHGL